MNNPTPTDPAAPESQQEMVTAMFASMVIQQSNMASIFLGLVPNPQTGQTEQNLEHARYFIDQLEMIEVKTRGNLDKMEEGLLKQSLTSLRLAFVEAVSKPGEASQSEEKPAANTAPSEPSSEPAPDGGATTADDSRKKFTKKY